MPMSKEAQVFRNFSKSLEEFLKDRALPAPTKPYVKPPKNALEMAWDKMTEDQQCLAYGKTVLADAAHRDKVFPRENNVANARYEMATKYAYGSGAR